MTAGWGSRCDFSLFASSSSSADCTSSRVELSAEERRKLAKAREESELMVLRVAVQQELCEFRRAVATKFTLKSTGDPGTARAPDAIHRTVEVLEFWKKLAAMGRFPNLHIVAVKLFSVRVTTASAERLFSFAGLIDTCLRNRMSAPVFDALVCFSYCDKDLQEDREEAFQLRRRRMNRSFGGADE